MQTDILYRPATRSSVDLGPKPSRINRQAAHGEHDGRPLAPRPRAIAYSGLAGALGPRRESFS